MPSAQTTNTKTKKRRKRSTRRKSSRSTKKKTIQPAALSFQRVFFALILVVTFVLWVLYRSLFSFPVWFDETFGKALFFGLPVWLFVAATSNKQVADVFRSFKFESGLLQGIAYGGVFGFFASLVFLIRDGAALQAAPLFASSEFWYEFMLALFTGFWETLLFYGLIMVVLQQTRPKWSLVQHVLVTALIFTLFHLPNAILRFDGTMILTQAALLLAFSIGQGFIFARDHNGYTLVLSHAIWGMVLLVHGG